MKALQKHGMILADNGSGIYISGAPDNRWSNDDLGSLHQLTAADFEVVSMGTIYTPPNVPQGGAPVISVFKATPLTITAGAKVTLSWSGSGSEYNIITPTVGAVRETSILVSPRATRLIN